MDTSKVSFGEMIAGVSGALLIVFMVVLDWWGYDIGRRDPVASGAERLPVASFLDIILLLIGADRHRADRRARGRARCRELPAASGLIVAGAGALAVLIILFRILIPGDGPAGDLADLADVDATRKIGAFLGLLAAGGIAFGGWTAMNERASGQAPPALGDAAVRVPGVGFEPTRPCGQRF